MSDGSTDQEEAHDAADKSGLCLSPTLNDIFNATKHLHLSSFNGHNWLSLVHRYFRDSSNERGPAKTASGDHVSHQADNRKAYLSQTQQDGIRRG